MGKKVKEKHERQMERERIENERQVLEILLNLDGTPGHHPERRKGVRRAAEIRRGRKMNILKKIKIETETKIEKTRIKMKKRKLKKNMKDKWKERGLKMRDKKRRDWIKKKKQE